MKTHVTRDCLLLGATMLLAACGGGGSGVSFTPAPPYTPPPPPPNPGPPPVPSGPIGLQSAAPFKTVSAGGNMSVGTDAVQFSYSASDNRYTVTIPGSQQGQLVTTGANGSYNGSVWTNINSTVNDVTVGSTSAKQDVFVVLDWPASSSFKYTSMARWWDRTETTGTTRAGVFAYGIPTAQGDVPLSGSASYGGTIRGLSNAGDMVFGSVSLNFDFGAATLSGNMKPEITGAWDPLPPLGTYTFRDTVFAKGSTTFSGAFDVPGSTAPSSFQGSFAGPQGVELLANWTAPYQDPLSHQWGTISGVWTARKQ